MEVKEAVGIAKAYIKDLYSDEAIVNLGLEEVRYDDAERQWRITVGFSRQWQQPRVARWESRGVNAVIEKLSGTDSIQDKVLGRTFKLATISDETGKVISVTDRGTLD